MSLPGGLQWGVTGVLIGVSSMFRPLPSGGEAANHGSAASLAVLVAGRGRTCNI